LLAVATPVQAGPRDEAKRHFRTGMELIATGDLDGGISELEQAYEILPHPNVLFNIGRAYLDAGRVEPSLPYFRRYVDSGAPDAAEVQLLIEQEERKLAEAAAAAEESPAQAAGGEATAEQIEALTELAERLERAASELEQGPRRAAGTGLGEATMTPDELLAAKSMESVYEEVVVSASRQATSPLDAPVSTEILTAEDIRLSGATNLPDLLRRVAGVEIMQMGAGNHNIGIRGFNARMNNKVLVLVDGRSVYMDFLGTTFWRTLDVNLADVERIEVVRGPGSTLYGANAFSGVVNIITRPRGEKSAEFGVIGGMGRTIQGNVRYSDRIKTVGYALSVGYEQTDRFQLEYSLDREDLVPQVNDPNLAVRALRVNGGVNWLPRRDTQFSLSGGVSSAFEDFYAIGLLRNMYVDGVFPWVRLDVKHKGLNARAFWNHYDTDAGPTWHAPGTLDSLFTHVLANTVDVEASYGGEAQLGVPHHITVGAGFRVKTIDWDFLDEPKVERHLNGFVEDRITLHGGNERFGGLAAVAGFRFDQHPLVGFTPSPRIALVAKPTPRMAIRASAGTAFRIPTFMESYLALRVPGTVTGVELITYGNTGLDPELIRSLELGYRYEGSDYFMFDVAAYYQRVSNLIALGDVTSTPDAGLDPAQPDRFVVGTSRFENEEQVFSGFGVEPAVHVFPVDGLDISVNYAFNYLLDLDLMEADEPARDARTPLHKINASVQYRSPFFMDFGVDLHYVSAYTIPERAFDEVGAVQLDPLEMDSYVILNARVIVRLLQDRLNIGVTGFNLTAFGGDGGHFEHAFGTRIGPRVYGTVSYRF